MRVNLNLMLNDQLRDIDVLRGPTSLVSSSAEEMPLFLRLNPRLNAGRFAGEALSVMPFAPDGGHWGWRKKIPGGVPAPIVERKKPQPDAGVPLKIGVDDGDWRPPPPSPPEHDGSPETVPVTLI